MPLPFSKSQIERLGTRLVSRSEPAPEDLEALHALLSAYGEVLEDAVATVRETTGGAPTARVKNTGTILEKLERLGGSWLKSIDDLAGMRIVGEFDRNGQDELVAELTKLFADAPRPPKIVDRRAEPMQGYRAVHVIVFPDGVPIEIQVRTRFQHEWAETFEKFADQVGRGIRYGERPAHWLASGVLDLAMTDAALIDAFELAEQQAPHDPSVAELREMVARAVAQLSDGIDEWLT